MSTKYPIILVHGLMLKDYKSFRAFGHIERFLRSKGYSVYTSDADGVGSIENNALQLKRQILKIIRESGAKKVNLMYKMDAVLQQIYDRASEHGQIRFLSYLSLHTSLRIRNRNQALFPSKAASRLDRILDKLLV